MKNVFISCLFFTIAACATHPVDLSKEINAAAESEILKTEPKAISERPETALSLEKKLELTFDKSDRLVLINGNRSPAKVISFKTDEAPLLVIASVIKSAGWRKDALVVPKISFYKDGQSVKAPKIKQMGVDSWCGMMVCAVTAYDLKTLPKGNYKALLAAYVERPEQPLEFRKVSGMYYAGAVPLFISAERAQYASYYGEVKVNLAKELPFKPSRKDVQTF